MKKSGALFLTICLIFTLFCSCTVIDKNKQETLYKSAIAQLQDTPLHFDGTSNVNKALLQAIYHEEFVRPKNVIFMIGDGMGFNAVTATEQYYQKQLYAKTLALHTLPVQSSQSTYSESGAVTDSAAGGTALATGYKTTNGTIAMDSSATIPYQTTLELAAELGKRTGLIATKSITDATPAAFSAHVGTRAQEADIAGQQLQKFVDGDLDIVLGGGAAFYEDEQNSDLLLKAKENGLTYTTTWEETQEATLPLAGLLSEGQLDTYSSATPAQMTDLALNLLSENEEGFFLMIEGSQIDLGSHANNLDYMAHELYQFDDAVAVAMRFVAFHPDTILIITADHETGGLQLPENLTPETIKDAYYTTGGHTGADVPVYALGYGTQQLAGVNDNTDIAKFIAASMGEHSFGNTNESKQLLAELEQKIRTTTAKMQLDNALAAQAMDNMQQYGSFCSKTAIAFDAQLLQRKKEMLLTELNCPIDYLLLIDEENADDVTNKLYQLALYVSPGTSVTIGGETLTKTGSNGYCDIYSTTIEHLKHFTIALDITFEKNGIAHTITRYIAREFLYYDKLVDLADTETLSSIKAENPAVLIGPEQLTFTMGENNPVLIIPADTFTMSPAAFTNYQVIKVTISNPNKQTVPIPLLEIDAGKRDAFFLPGDKETLAPFEKAVISYELPDVLSSNADKMAIIDSLQFIYENDETTFEFSDFYIAMFGEK